MEYTFYSDNATGVEYLRTKSEKDARLSGFCQSVQKNSDSVVTDVFFVVRNTKNDTDIAGNFYNWYEINQHYRMVEKVDQTKDQAVTLARVLASSVTTLSDTTALTIPDLLPTWAELLAAGQPIQPGVCLMHNGQCYRQSQAAPVTPRAHQPPGGDGMLAVYRPIDREHAGTLADPIPWVYGMDCTKDKYYIHNGTIYRARQTMKACAYEPGGLGLDAVWEVVE